MLFLQLFLCSLNCRRRGQTQSAEDHSLLQITLASHSLPVASLHPMHLHVIPSSGVPKLRDLRTCAMLYLSSVA